MRAGLCVCVCGCVWMYVRPGVYSSVCERECVRVSFLGHVCACVSLRVCT